MKLARCRHGYMLYNPLDAYIGRSFDLYGEFSQGEVEMFEALIKPEHTVLDVGANIGAHTIPFAKMADHVVAFEPQRLVYQTMTANVALNELQNVVTVHAGVGAQPGDMFIPVLDPSHEHNFGGFSLPQAQEVAKEQNRGEAVPIVPLDAFRLNRVDFIKIDVEGMELEVLKGAQSMIEFFKPILYVEDDREQNRSDLRDFITGLGYQFEEHQPMLFNPENESENNVNVFGQIRSLNLVCYPMEKAA